MKLGAAAFSLILAAACTAPAVQATDAAAQIELGRRLFTQDAVPPCALCHTLADAGSAGAVGPVLDEIKPDARRVATALRNGVGAMPSFRERLNEAQIEALAAYVSKVTGGAP
ncbi:Cytochrome c, mono-and diheme variants [Rubrivivax sp. A210]|uniref:SorU family sulfite dehydrogenase c-type cytochrome subunit n=1 Tax=Rubrivivax sp. A210 TaxID=2772301 RepID=UPI0019AACC4A|nr:cytochrome c [Rubrivivax sp. A210]CAD5370151.1 Cytochrome c, mono-and diheme variants [Rubrivivax sp. A210]